MNYKQLVEDFSNLLAQFKQELIAILPNFISALLVLLVGIVFARFIKALATRFIKKLPKIIPNKKFQSKISRMRPERTANLIGNILFWMILFFFLTAATEILGLPVITAWLSGIVKYLPNILIAVLIVFLGIVGGTIARDLLITTANTAGVTYGNVMGKLVQYAILFISILISIEQIGIDTAVLSGLIYIVLGAILFGAALAFGLGARTSVSNILASHYLQDRYREGQTIRLGELEGEISEITATAVIIRTPAGEACIPAKEFSETASIRLKKHR